MYASGPQRAPRRFTLAALTPLAGLVVLGGSAVCVQCGFDKAATGPSVVEGGSTEDATQPDAESSFVLLDSGLDDLDADTPIEAGSDGACPPSSFKCADNGACFTKCTSCKGGTFACATTGACVARCSTCTGRKFECLACSGGGKTLPKLAKSTCEVDPTTCNGAGADYCDCKALGGCFGAFQICLKVGKDSQCRGCGDDGTNDKSCIAAGTTCTAPTFGCQ